MIKQWRASGTKNQIWYFIEPLETRVDHGSQKPEEPVPTTSNS